MASWHFKKIVLLNSCHPCESMHQLFRPTKKILAYEEMLERYESILPAPLIFNQQVANKISPGWIFRRVHLEATQNSLKDWFNQQRINCRADCNFALDKNLRCSKNKNSS